MSVTWDKYEKLCQKMADMQCEYSNLKVEKISSDN
jgi:hypothetical protein